MPITIGIGITVKKKNSFRVFSSVSSMVWGRKHGNHYSLIYLYNLYNSAQVYLMKFEYMVHELITFAVHEKQYDAWTVENKIDSCVVDHSDIVQRNDSVSICQYWLSKHYMTTVSFVFIVLSDTSLAHVYLFMIKDHLWTACGNIFEHKYYFFSL